MRSGVGTGHGSVPLLGFFLFSGRNYKALTMEWAPGHWKDSKASLSNLCKQRTEGRWQAEVVGGKGLSGQRSASFQEKDELHFPGELPDNGIRDLVGCHIQLSPSPSPGNTSPIKQNEHSVEHPLLPCAPPPTLTLLDWSSYTDPAFLSTSRIKLPFRQEDTHWTQENKLRGKDRDTHCCFL